MRYFVIPLFIFLFFSAGLSQSYKKVKIYINSKDDVSTLLNAGLEFDHYYYSKEDKSIEVFIGEDEFKILQSVGFDYKVTIDDWYEYYKNRSKLSHSEKQSALAKAKSSYGVSGFNFGSMGGFYTLAEVIAELDTMRMLFPQLITAKESIGSTAEGRPIYVVKISDNPAADEDEPEVLYTALHHAREPQSMMQMIYFMYYLLENYNTVPSVKYLVNNRELFFIPVLNPDGYEYNRITNPDGAGFWRKNRRDNGNEHFGVDLNRNYGPQNYWNAPNGGSSSLTASENYRGPSPFSEPETQAVRDFISSHKIKTVLNYHSFGNYLIYPYGASEKETPDSSIFRELAGEMTQYNNYFFGTDQQTVGYSTRGNSDDYFHDGDTLLNGGKIFAMTPEVGSGVDGFWPEQDRIVPLAEENVYPNLTTARAAGEYIKLNDLNLPAGYLHPGESIEIYPSFKNAGLKDADNVRIEISSLTSNSSTNDYISEFASISSGASVTLTNPFSLSVSETASSEQDILLLYTVYIDGTEASEDTISINVDGPVLPVELQSFTAAAIDNGILLKWNTATEINNHGFEIQRAGEDGEFLTLAFIRGNGTSTETSYYSFIDKHPLQGKSLYRLKQTDFDGTFKYSGAVEINFASQYSLEQNYPNPFNPATSIKFSIARAGYVTLRIYDILGSEVVTLVDKEMEPGVYEINFNASSLTGGIYFVRLQSGQFLAARQMLLLK